MELRQLRQFVTVAEVLDFRKATELLHTAQPIYSLKKLGARSPRRSTAARGLGREKMTV